MRNPSHHPMVFIRRMSSECPRAVYNKPEFMHLGGGGLRMETRAAFDRSYALKGTARCTVVV
jgi:hypothetical protein